MFCPLAAGRISGDNTVSIIWLVQQRLRLSQEKVPWFLDHLPSIALGASGSQLGQTQVPTMRHSSLRGKLPLHLTLSLVCLWRNYGSGCCPCYTLTLVVPCSACLFCSHTQDGPLSRPIISVRLGASGVK